MSPSPFELLSARDDLDVTCLIEDDHVQLTVRQGKAVYLKRAATPDEAAAKVAPFLKPAPEPEED